jgi:hypothetical protein
MHLFLKYVHRYGKEEMFLQSCPKSLKMEDRRYAKIPITSNNKLGKNE